VVSGDGEKLYFGYHTLILSVVFIDLPRRPRVSSLTVMSALPHHFMVDEANVYVWGESVHSAFYNGSSHTHFPIEFRYE